MTSARPGLIVRLGNLIIVQVVFIFVAVLLIIFSPDRQQLAGDRLHNLEEHLEQLGRTAATSLPATGSIDTSGSAYLALRESLEESKYVRSASVVSVTQQGDFAVLLSLTPDGESEAWGEAIPASDLGAIFQPGRARRNSWSVLHSDRLIYFQRLTDDKAATPAYLVAVVDHGLLMASRSGLIYALLILFLFSTLISLLLLSLVSKRFRQPLERLIRGFEKTAQGELYHLVEPEDDRELGKLASAYNRMVETLWENHKRLRDYNAKLKRSNYSILESQLFLATIIDSSPLSIVVVNPAGEIIVFNRAASDVFGFEPDEVVGRPFSDLIAEGDVEPETDDEDNAEGEKVFEVIARRNDGDLFPAYVAAAGIASQDGQRGATLYMCRDISESKRFQDMMIRLDRYYTRGQMAGDIAHEINNYLAVLMGNLELLPLLLKKGNSEKVDKKLAVMLDTVDKIARFANGLMDVPQEEVRLEQSSLNQIVENVVAFLKPQNRFDTVDIATNLSIDIPLLMLDQGQIQQLLVNLIYNASDAVSANERNDKRIAINTLVSRDGDGEWACVEVRDNGPGVAPEREEALFKERFTTKRKGHGIGLITCRKIVENHRGSVRYRSDGGGVFTACFPTRPAPSDTPETETIGETQRA